MTDKRSSFFGGNKRDDDDDDDEDDKGRSSSSSSRPGNPFNRPSPFNRSNDKDDDEDDDDDKSEKNRPSSPANRPGGLFGSSKPSEPPKSSSPFGGSKSSEAPKPGSPFGGSKSSEPSKPGSPFGGSKSSESPKPGSPFGGSKSPEPPKPGSPFGSKASDSSRSTGTFGSKPADPPKSGGLFGSKPADPPKPSGMFGSKPADPPKASSPFGTSSKPADPPKSGGLFGGSKPAPAEPAKPGLFGGGKPADKKDDKPAPGSSSGARTPFGGGAKPAEKKDEKPAGGGLFGGRSLPFGGGNKPDEKKDDKSSGGSRLPFGGGGKPAEKKDEKPSGGLGGVKLPFGGGGAKPADKPAPPKKDDKPSGGGLFGGIKLPFGGGKSDEKKDDKSAAKPGFDPKRSSSSLPAPNIGNKPAAVTSAPKPASSDDKSKAPPLRSDRSARPLDKAAKPVMVKSQGLSLDQKLDLVGYVLIVSGVVVFFGILNPTDGSVTATITNLLRQLFGWAALVLPVPFVGVGLWLLIRHFKETPHVLDVKRTIGLVLMYLTIVASLQLYALSSTYTPTIAALETASAGVAKTLQGGGWVGDRLYIFLVKVVAGDFGTVAILIGSFVISITLAFEITMAEISSYAKSVFQWFARVFGSYQETRRASIEAKEAERAAAKAAAAALQPPEPVPALAGGPTPAAAALNAPVRSKQRVPELAGGASEIAALPPPAPPPALAAESSRLRPSAPPAPLGSRPMSVAAPTLAPPDEDEEIISEEEPVAPVARPAPAPFGSRSSGGQAAPAKTNDAKKPGLFGGRASPFGGGSKTAEPADGEEAEAAPPAPIPVIPGDAAGDSGKKPGLFGAKASPFGGKSNDAPKAEASVAAKPADAPAKADEPKKGGLFGGRSLPFGSKPSAAPQEDKQTAVAESKPADTRKPGLFGSKPSPSASNTSAANKVDVPVEDEVDDEAEEVQKPVAFGAKAAPFGSKPSNAGKADVPVEDEVEDDEAEEPQKPGMFGVKASPFGSKPGDSPSKVADSRKPGMFGAKPAGKPESLDEDEDLEDDEAPPAPVSPKPSMFGARPSSPFGKPARDEDLDEDGEDEDDVPPAAPISKPNPFGARPTSAPKDNDSSQSRGAASRPFEVTPAIQEDKPVEASKPGLFGARPDKSNDTTDQKATELVGKDNVEDSSPKPASPVGGKPGPFGSAAPTRAEDSKPLASEAIAQTGALGSVAAVNASDKVESAGKVSVEPEKAKIDGKNPNPFGNVVASTAAASKVADSEEDELDKPKAQDTKPADAPLKPASPAGGKPSPFGTFAAPKLVDKDKPVLAGSDLADNDRPPTPLAPKPSLFGAPVGATSRPVPKPSMATPPPLEDENTIEDDEPKYVDLDDEDEPSASGPRPTVAGKLNTPVSNMPRPASPVVGRPRPDDRNTAPGAPKPSPFGVKPPFAAASDPIKPGVPTASKPVEEAKKLDDSAQTAPVISAKADLETTAPARAEPKVEDKPAIKSAPIAEAPKPTPPAAPAKPAAALEGTITRSKPPSAWETPDFQEVLQAGSQQEINDEILEERKRVIEETLSAFGAPAKVVEVNSGPVITQFGVEPGYLSSRGGKATRVKVSAIARLDADLALALAARTIRIEAPVPGKGYVGIEVPNAETALVGLRDIMESEQFQKINSKLRIALGKSVDGAPIAADLTMMPHLLIAGTTGSGKSVCVNAIISCLLLENSPDDMKFIMVDPKRVELTNYNGIPHLVSPVVVDLERISGVLKWVSREMDERYKKFSAAGARNILDYNSKLKPTESPLPYLVMVIDELADLMMLAPEETEKVLTRLAQMARATGIHLIISTQRPSVDVVTGLIKANFPARISFAVASSVDSRVILDSPGAEKLLGRGDMLYQSPESAAPVRMQGVYVSDAEINRITRHWKGLRPEQDSAKAPALSGSGTMENGGASVPMQSRPAEASHSVISGNGGDDANDEDDALYRQAVDEVKRVGKASSLFLQRRLQIGPVRAERLIKLMEQRGDYHPNET